MAENMLAGIETLLDHRNSHRAQRFTEDGQLIKDSVIIAHMNHNSANPATKRGLVLPFATGLLIDGLAFVNFDGARPGGGGTILNFFYKDLNEVYCKIKL